MINVYLSIDIYMIIVYYTDMRHSKLDRKKALAINLKNIRMSLKKTQAEFAELIGLPQATISRYESAKSMPDDDGFNKLTKALKIEETDLTSHPDLLLAFKTFSKNKLK